MQRLVFLFKQEESNMDMFMKNYKECKEKNPKAPSMGAPPKPPGPPNPNECPEDEDEKIKDKGMDAEKAKKMCTKMSPDQKKEFDSDIDKVEKKVGKQNSDEDAAKIMCSEAAKHNIMKLVMECQ
uniref:(California timema) hypothetical protein n=1 Tax=Timema californicum TaxID=61474 RepID=A0A7R9J2U5_TIMCA|nr:unnamed protein product [Timema californicum]